MNKFFDFIVDKEKSQVRVSRSFAAPLANVWAAWTQRELLDQWWAPKPWKTRTKHMDFTPGGHWFYAMVGPAGEEHWCRNDYKTISPMSQFTAFDAFCTPDGAINTEFPSTKWEINFSEIEGGTAVNIVSQYESLATLEMIISMGFQEGFTMALGNLDELLLQK